MNPKITKWFADLASKTFVPVMLIGAVASFFTGPLGSAVAVFINNAALTWLLFSLACIAIAISPWQREAVEELIRQENRKKLMP